MTRVEGARDPSALIQELADNDIQTFDKPSRDDPFGDLKNRFSRFKKQACLYVDRKLMLNLIDGNFISLIH